MAETMRTQTATDRPSDPWGRPRDLYTEGYMAGHPEGYREGRRDMLILIGVCAAFVGLATAGLWLI